MSFYSTLKPYNLEDHSPEEGYIFLLHTIESQSGLRKEDQYYFFRILDEETIEFLVTDHYDKANQTLSFTYQEELSRPLRKGTMINYLKGILNPDWLESGAEIYLIESPLITENEFIQVLDDITTDLVLNGYIGEKKWKDSSIVKYCRAIGLTLNPTIHSDSTMSCNCPTGYDHEILIQADTGEWSCVSCREEGQLEELEEFINKCKNGYKPNHSLLRRPSINMGTSFNILRNLQTAITLAQKSAKLKKWETLEEAGSIVQEMCKTRAVYNSLRGNIPDKRTKKRLLRQLKMFEESIPVVYNFMAKALQSIKESECSDDNDPVAELFESGANLASILAKISNRGNELNDQAKAGTLIKAWGRSGLVMEERIHWLFNIKPKIISEHRKMISDLIDFLIEVTEHSMDQSDHLLRIELVEEIDRLHDILIHNNISSFNRLKEYRFQYQLQDTSREYWFMGRIFMLIHSTHRNKKVFTTEAIQEKYELEGRTQILPRIEKIGPDWAYLTEWPYKNPSSQDWGEYLVIYELSIDYKFNLPVIDYEPENHPYIVIRDNTEKIEIKEFKYVNGKPVLVHDYW